MSYLFINIPLSHYSINLILDLFYLYRCNKKCLLHPAIYLTTFLSIKINSKKINNETIYKSDVEFCISFLFFYSTMISKLSNFFALSFSKIMSFLKQIYQFVNRNQTENNTDDQQIMTFDQILSLGEEYCQDEIGF